MPTPEQLGVAGAPIPVDDELDWQAAHRQLEKLGAVCSRMDKLENGGCRFTCFLPTAQPGFTHRVEADAPRGAEAVRLAINQAEDWVNHAK